MYIEAMNGVLEVESVLGEGSTFTLVLPACKNPNIIMLNTKENSTITHHQNENKGLVLYIEDNKSAIDLVNKILVTQLPMVRLITSMYGKKGLELALNSNPDLILLDIDLPDIHGSEVIRLLKENPKTKSIPVIITSADTSPNQIDKLLKLGAEEYITKPIDVISFVNSIASCLNKKG